MRLLPTLAIVCSVMAALTALVTGVAIILLAGLVAVVAGVLLVLRRDRAGLSMGGVAVILGLMGMVGGLGTVSTEGGSLDFGIQASLGHALVIVALLAVGGGLLWANWGRFDQALAIGAAVVAAVAAVLAFVFQADLGDPTTWQAFIVSLLSLASMLAGILALRLPE